jgi:hypothetical protein
MKQRQTYLTISSRFYNNLKWSSKGTSPGAIRPAPTADHHARRHVEEIAPVAGR